MVVYGVMTGPKEIAEAFEAWAAAGLGQSRRPDKRASRRAGRRIRWRASNNSDPCLVPRAQTILVNQFIQFPSFPVG